MLTDHFTEAPPAPNLFAQLRELWLGAGHAPRPRDPRAARFPLEHLDDHMRRDIGLDPKERPLLSRADFILQLPR